jgi:hypothetical protein
MLLIDKPIDLKRLKELAEKNFAGLLKAVVDVEKKIMVIGGEMHADEEKMLLENGSKQQDLWGINLYPQNFGKEDFIEFDSVINLRPSQNNLSRFVEDEKIRQKIIKIVNQLIKK